MKKRNKIVLALSVSTVLGVAGIIIFPICGTPSYVWTNPTTGESRPYGIGWLNYENTSSYLSNFEPHFYYFLNSLSSANIEFGYTQIKYAEYWLAVSKDPNDIRKYTEAINFFNCYVSAIPMFVMSLIGLLMVAACIPIFAISVKKLVKLDKKNKNKIIDPLF